MMEQIIEKITAEFPGWLASISGHAEQFDRYLVEHCGSVPRPLIYLFGMIVAGILLYSIARVLLRLALFVVMPAAGSTLIAVYAFPTLETAKVAPIAAMFFLVLFIFKH
jgi:hypothetical protein